FDVARARPPFPLRRVILWVVILGVALDFGIIVANNPNFGWPVVAAYFFDPTVMEGLTITLGLTVIAMVIGVALGLILAIARMSQDRLASSLSNLFIWFFRGTPLLVQLIFWYNLSTLFPKISLAIPFGPTLISWNTNDIITPLTAAIVGLALNEAA
ncbi:ABC transporter permease subunit, partial [Ochrobactrum sp. SFR4]|uniref:ABC transporter permease subunit n=1 Tax=Ochrobactrum sp. SFR4 TaxID=2717368 RepID=UPI001C8CD56B